MQISLNNYSNILKEIKETIQITKANIDKTVNQEKVLMSWKIGRTIEGFLSDQSQYGSQLIDQLERDVLIPQSTLYQMRLFYKTYPDLKEKKINLNWSHYRALITIKDQKERQYFENFALENALGSNDLRLEISRNKDKEIKIVKTSKQLYPKRGELFNYKLTTLAGSNKKFVDCGFKVFIEIETSLKPPLNVTSKKDKNGKISLSSTLTPKSKLYTYKAHLEKVVDGDTLRVVLDLGFGVRHKEILRLAGINAPEMKTVEGKSSAAALSKILKDVKFLVIKTNKVDIFGRYIADVFFEKGELDASKVASKGTYLNRLLLDKGLVELY